MERLGALLYHYRRPGGSVLHRLHNCICPRREWRPPRFANRSASAHCDHRWLELDCTPGAASAARGDGDGEGSVSTRFAPMMNFKDQDRQCHPERSEGSDSSSTEILRCAQDDMLARFQITYRFWLLIIIIGDEHGKPAPTNADTFVSSAAGR